VSSVDQAVIDLVKGVFIWGVPGLEVDLFVHEVRSFSGLLAEIWNKCKKLQAQKNVLIAICLPVAKSTIKNIFCTENPAPKL
jgi:hypothetical protein